MSSLQISPSRVAGAKRALRASLDVPSAHLGEALAAAFGFASNAALTAALKRAPDGLQAEVDAGAFLSRLAVLGHPATPEVAGRYLQAALQAAPRHFRRETEPAPPPPQAVLPRPLQRLIQRARVNLFFASPYLGSAALCLDVWEDPDVPMFSLAPGRLGYNRGYLGLLTQRQLEAALAFAAAHVLLGHAGNCGSRDARLWETACELAVGPVLARHYVRSRPDGSPVAGRGPGYPADWTAERIYADLEALASSGGAQPVAWEPWITLHPSGGQLQETRSPASLLKEGGMLRDDFPALLDDESCALADQLEPAGSAILGGACRRAPKAWREPAAAMALMAWLAAALVSDWATAQQASTDQSHGQQPDAAKAWKLRCGRAFRFAVREFPGEYAVVFSRTLIRNLPGRGGPKGLMMGQPFWREFVVRTKDIII